MNFLLICKNYKNKQILFFSFLWAHVRLEFTVQTIQSDGNDKPQSHHPGLLWYKKRHNPTFLFDHSRFDLYFSIKCGQVVNVIYLKRYAEMRTCCVDPWYRLLCGAHIGHNNHGGVGDWKILMEPKCAKDFNSTRSSNGELRLDVGLLMGRNLGLSNSGLKLNRPKLSSVPCGLGPAQSDKEAKHYNFSTLSRIVYRLWIEH